MHGISSAVDVAFPSGNPVELRRHLARLDLRREPGARPRTRKPTARSTATTCSTRARSPRSSSASARPSTSASTHQVAQGPNFAGPIRSPPPICRRGTARPIRATSAAASAATSRATSGSSRRASSSAGVTSTRTAIRLTRRFWSGEFSLKENVAAVYVMANLEGQGWSGNVGVRVVQTKERVLVNVGLPSCRACRRRVRSSRTRSRPPRSGRSTSSRSSTPTTTSCRAPT